jgi:hypothetical protein
MRKKRVSFFCRYPLPVTVSNSGNTYAFLSLSLPLLPLIPLILPLPLLPILNDRNEIPAAVIHLDLPVFNHFREEPPYRTVILP